MDDCRMFRDDGNWKITSEILLEKNFETKKRLDPKLRFLHYKDVFLKIDCKKKLFFR